MNAVTPMRCWRLIISLAILLPGGWLLSQVSTGFSGYVANLPIYQRAITDTAGALGADLTRLRLRPVVQLSANGRFQIEYEVAVLYQSTAITSTFPPGKTDRQLIDARWRPVAETHVLVDHFVDRLYYRHDFNWGNMVAGRQRVAWGNGRIWNPTDLFNPINPAAFDKIEKDGADLLTSQVYLGSFTDLTLVYNPREVWRTHNAGFRFRSNYHTYDLALVGGYFDERVVMGADFAGNLLVAGVRGEGTITFDPQRWSGNYVRYILGIDMQFSTRLYGLIEYLYNGRGTRNREAYDLGALARGEIINLNKQYLFSQWNYQLHPLVFAGVGWNGNLADGSGFASLTVSYAWRENADILAGGQFFYGTPGDEYHLYPSAYFLKGQFFF